MSEEKMKVMKEDEIRKAAKCAMCGKPFGKTGLPLFWRVTVDRYVVDMNAVRRLQGLTMLTGSPVLASVFSPDEVLARQALEVKITVCEDCCTESIPVAYLAELGSSEGDNA